MGIAKIAMIAKNAKIEKPRHWYNSEHQDLNRRVRRERRGLGIAKIAMIAKNAKIGKRSA